MHLELSAQVDFIAFFGINNLVAPWQRFLENLMELKQTENTNDAKEGATLLASVQVEFVNIYEETNEELALAMNCSNG